MILVTGASGFIGSKLIYHINFDMIKLNLTLNFFYINENIF